MKNKVGPNTKVMVTRVYFFTYANKCNDPCGVLKIDMMIAKKLSLKRFSAGRKVVTLAETILSILFFFFSFLYLVHALMSSDIKVL